MTIPSSEVLSPLAVEGSSVLWILVIGLLIAVVLLIAFWYGSRRNTRHVANLPTTPQRGADSWQSADESLHPHEGDDDGRTR
ncbi:DUF6479 family protein [Streptomyces sp. NPDC004111]|uniref:DUF6479 family protein n=1 Tax=Streptomyces sp. NPDC004111 TaxID=3364690 RepID=UPI00369B8F2C